MNTLKDVLLKMKGAGLQSDSFVNGLVTGLPDGIMILFVVTTGLSAAGVSNTLSLMAGGVAIVIGALTMGISAYATSNEERGYFTDDLKSKELKERRFLANLGIGEDIQQMAAREIEKDHAKWAGLMQSPPHPASALNSGLAVALGYGIGGIIPLIPFFYDAPSLTNLGRSALLTLVALLVSGYIKGRYTGARPFTTILRITVIALLAAGSMYAAVRLIFG